MIQFKNATFIKTAIYAKDYPKLQLPEIAVAGRSNVGKSSLLNHLFRSKNLVKTSATPGKTQAINFFSLNEQVVFVDLPGYGYAKVPDGVKKQWGPMIQGYLESREQLRAIIFLLDIRRVPNDDDKKFLEWVAHIQKPVIIVLTKVDKVTAQECKNSTKRILEELPFENLSVIHYSVLLNRGRDMLVRLIQQAMVPDDSN